MPQLNRIFLVLMLGLLLPSQLFAQTSPADSLGLAKDSLAVEAPREEVTEDSIKYKEPFPYKPNRIHIGVDAYPLISSAVDPDISSGSVHLGVGFSDRFWLQADFGYEDNFRRSEEFPLYVYQTKGTFMRLGLDYNITYWDIPGDALMVGLHYGTARFSQTVQYFSSNEVWGDVTQFIERDGVSGSWLEPRMTLQVSAFKKLSLEALAGFRVRLSSKGYEVEPNEIPGLGLTKTRARLTMGYRLCYILDFRKS